MRIMEKLTDQTSEQDILNLAQQQNSEAVDYLLEKYKTMVRGKARSLYMIGGDRDDLVQEGMIGLFKAIQNYDVTRDAAFSTFAELCVSRQIYSAIKSSNRLKNMPLNTYVSIYAPSFSAEGEEQENGFMIDASLSSRQQNPEDILIRRESSQQLQEQLLEQLSKMERAVFEAYLQGKTYQEIAHEMDKTPKSIDNALQRIKAKVNSLLE